MNSFIETLNQWGGNFVSFAWPMLWQSSLLIAGLFAVDLFFQRRMRASIRYALWLVVLVKLCVPPTLALPTSPAWWLHKTPPPIVAKAEPHYTITYDHTPLPEIPPAPLTAFVAPKPTLTNAAWLLVASAASLVLLCWLLVRWWQITRQIRRARGSERLATLADEAQTFIGTKFKVQVKLTTNAMSPAVCGLFRPAILIPQSLAANFSDEQLRAVLLHELIHLRRRDVWMNFAQALLQIVYWWHPLVWLANARIRRVREEAVDDAVMLALRDEADAYAPTLLEVAKLALNRPLASLGLVGIMESRHALRQRIERLIDFRPPRHTGLTLVSLLGILTFTAVAVPMGDGPQNDNNTPPVVSAKDTNSAADQSFTPTQTLAVNDEVVSNAWQKFVHPPANPTAKEKPTLIEAFAILTRISREHKVDAMNSYAVDALLRINSPNSEAVQALRRFIEAKDDSLPVLISSLNYSESNFWAADILGMMGSVAKPAVPALQNALQSRDEYTRWSVAVALNKIDPNFLAPPMLATNFEKTKNGKIDVEAMAAKAKAAHLVQDAKLDYEMGKMVDAEKLLKSALTLDVENNAAKYYLGLVQSARSSQKGGRLTPEHQNIATKLDLIRIPSVSFDHLGLGEVVRQLSEASRENDPDKLGVKISTVTSSVSKQLADINSVVINLPSPLKDALLADVLDSVILVAKEPIKYSIMDDGVVFSLKDRSEIPPLYSRHFRVGTNTFVAALHMKTGLETNNISQIAFIYFCKIGVNLNVPGKSVFFNERLGELFVRATSSDLDKIEQAIVEMPHSDEPQIHIKARFLEAPKGTLDGLKNVVSITNQFAGSNQVAGLVGILTDENFKTVLHTLEARPDGKTLAEPEVVTISGRRTQMRATVVSTMITNFVFEQNLTNSWIRPQTGPIETGSILDVVPKVLADGTTIDLQTTASQTEFWGYAFIPTNAPLHSVTNSAGEEIDLPLIWPALQISRATGNVSLHDRQTLLMTLNPPEQIRFAEPDEKREAVVAKHIRDGQKKNYGGERETIVFITATLVDPAGKRVHADGE